MLLMIDNYDSFTYNLVQYFGELGKAVTTIRNDQATLDDLIELKPDHVVVSPGPCDPDQAGISLKAIEYFAGKSTAIRSVSRASSNWSSFRWKNRTCSESDAW